MKTLNVVFTDDEYRRLSKAKKIAGYQNWHVFILSKCGHYVSVKKDYNK